MTTAAPAPAFGAKTSAIKVAEHFADQIRGRTVLSTGPTIGGVGYATALALYKQDPSLLVLAGRNVDKLDAAKQQLQQDVPNANGEIRLLQLDTSSMTSVRTAVDEVKGYAEPIDIIINNAAVMDTPYTITLDGHELQLATNYLGHWLFLNLIIDKVLIGKNKRVVNVSGMGHMGGNINWQDPHFEKGYDRKKFVQQDGNKPAFHRADEAMRRYDSQGLTSFSLHPGGIETPLQRHWTFEQRMQMNKESGMTIFKEDGTANMSDDTPWKTPEQGASTAALDPSIADHSGEYMDDCQLAPGNAKDYAKDPEAAKRAWDWTNKLLGTDF